MKPGLVVAGCVAAFILKCGAAYAVPLDTAACDAATAEQGQLSDVPGILERGPEWAKANAPAQTLKRVARWIELQEQLSFRCGRGRITAEAQRAAAAAELIENPPPPAAPPAAPTAAGAEKPAAAREAAVPAVVAPAAVVPVAPVVAPEVEPPKPKAVKAKPKSKPKTPPNDAQAATEPVVPPASEGDIAAAPVPKKKKSKPVDAFVPAPTVQTN